MIDTTTNSDPLFVTVWDAGRKLLLPPGTVKKRLEKGTFPIPYFKIGRNNVCHVADVAAFAEAMRLEAAKRHPEAGAWLQKIAAHQPAMLQRVTEDSTAAPKKRGSGRPRKG